MIHNSTFMFRYMIRERNLSVTKKLLMVLYLFSTDPDPILMLFLVTEKNFKTTKFCICFLQIWILF